MARRPPNAMNADVRRIALLWVGSSELQPPFWGGVSPLVLAISVFNGALPRARPNNPAALLM